MSVVRWVLAISAPFLLGAVCNANETRFDPVRDADRVKFCYSIYYSVGGRVQAPPPDRNRQTFIDEGKQGTKRIAPYAGAIWAIIGSEKFMLDSLEMTDLLRPRYVPDQALNQPVFERLMAEAQKCDRQFDAWDKVGGASGP